MPADRTFVIVGATRADAKAAETPLEEGVSERPVLIGAEHGISREHVAAVERGAA